MGLAGHAAGSTVREGAGLGRRGRGAGPGRAQNRPSGWALHGTCWLLALSALWIAPPAAAVEDGCAVSVVLAPSERAASVTLETNAAVTFQGKVAVNKPENWTGVVRLDAKLSRNWTVIVNPSAPTFAEGMRANATFNLTVIVPAATPANDPAQLTVTALGEFNGTSCRAQAQSIVRAREFHGTMSVDAAPSSVRVGSGSPPALVLVRAQQLTNSPGEPILSGVSAEAPAGLRVSIPPTVTLSSLTNTSIGAEFTAQLEWAGEAPGRHTVMITVRSGAIRSSEGAPVANATAFLEVIVPEPLGTFQLWASGAIGALVVCAAAVWLWRARPESPRRP